MRGVRVDPAQRTVRVEAGCTQGDVDHATHAFGLAVPAGIVSTTGIAGLTLGGGHGYLSREHGLTIDNLLEADVVLADGRSSLRASPAPRPVLGAARRRRQLRVVTSFRFRAHPVDTVYGGPIFYVATDGRGDAAYREFLPNAPEELSPFLGLKTVPSTEPFPPSCGAARSALVSCYNGSAEDRPRRRIARSATELPPPLLDGVTRCRSPRCRACSIRCCRPDCNGTGRATSCTSCQTRRSRLHLAQARQGALRAVAHAPLPDRRRGAGVGVGRDRLGRTGTPRGRWSSPASTRSGQGRRAQEVGARLLGDVHRHTATAALRELHDGRRGRGPRARGLRRQLRPPRSRSSARYDPANLFRVNQNIGRRTGGRGVPG
jgi:hypothetical protein